MWARPRQREWHAAMSLARLRRDRGKRADARDLVAPVWSTEGFRPAVLQEAKPLVEELDRTFS
jgi:hypothetical protein